MDEVERNTSRADIDIAVSTDGIFTIGRFAVNSKNKRGFA